MSQIELFKNEQITVLYHPDEKIIHHECHKPYSGKPFQDAIMAGTEALKKNRATKWLSDDRLNPILTPDDQKWAKDVWQPIILKAGWKFWAIVLPKEVIGQMRMNLMAIEYEKLGVTVKTFHDPIEAITWLKRV
jgi:hypothetical protein